MYLSLLTFCLSFHVFFVPWPCPFSDAIIIIMWKVKLEATKVVCITNAFFSWGSKEVWKVFSQGYCTKRKIHTYINTYCTVYKHVRIAPTNSTEYYNMCNTATLRTVGLHIVLTCLSGSGAFPLLRAVGTMWGAGPGGRSPPPPYTIAD